MRDKDEDAQEGKESRRLWLNNAETVKVRGDMVKVREMALDRLKGAASQSTDPAVRDASARYAEASGVCKLLGAT